jgi:hypothetical protein
MATAANSAGEINLCPTKKQKNPLDSDRPSHGRRLHQRPVLTENSTERRESFLPPYDSAVFEVTEVLMNRLKMTVLPLRGYEVLSFPSCIGHNRAGTGSEGPKAEGQRGSCSSVCSRCSYGHEGGLEEP